MKPSFPHLFLSAEEFRALPTAPSHLLPGADVLDSLSQPRAFEEILRCGASGADQLAIDTALNLAWVAVSWRRTGDARLAAILKKWESVFQKQEPVRIPGFATGNRDLLVGHILLSCAIMDDFLRGSFDPGFEAAVRRLLKAQAARAYADFNDPHAFPAFSYEQNHMIIPVCALGIAAEVVGRFDDEGDRWALFAEEFLSRSFNVIAYDGWFFEGVGYWKFTMQFPLCYAVVLQRAMGRSLLNERPFRDAVLYLAHNVLPDARFVFDFADWGPRVEPDGVGFQRGYDQPWHSQPTYLFLSLLKMLAREQGGEFWPRFISSLPVSPGIAALDATLQLMLPALELSTSPEVSQPVSHFFADMGVLHWRSKWFDPQASALAFKSGPPAGHHLATLLAKDPEWHLELGHAHPDAGSFLLFAHGVFLANDTGFTGRKETADHNGILVDGIGQHRGGTPWSTFTGKPYSEYARIRMENVWHDERVAAGTAVYEAAYDDTLGLRAMRRHLIFVDGRFLLILDTIESSIPHVYEWRLHTDQPQQDQGSGRFVMNNGPGRLVLQVLEPTATHRIAPTVVETEAFDARRSRPQQRGFHLALQSPRTHDFRFLVAMGVQAAKENPDSISARKVNDHETVMTDEQGSCRIIIGGAAQKFAYVLTDPSGLEIARGAFV